MADDALDALSLKVFGFGLGDEVILRGTTTPMLVVAVEVTARVNPSVVRPSDFPGCARNGYIDGRVKLLHAEAPRRFDLDELDWYDVSKLQPARHLHRPPAFNSIEEAEAWLDT